MKALHVISLLLLLIITGCSKDNTITAYPPPSENIAPLVFAGTDFQVLLPADSATLAGTASDAPADILNYHWEKISGPSSFKIEKPQSLHTKVYNLTNGTYEFELTVSDNGGLQGKDTITMHVYNPHIADANELIFKNLIWIFPWYASIEVKNINSYPTPRKVFIQRNFDSAWIEVSHISIDSNNNLYEYFIETRPDGAGMYNYGSLYIFYYRNNTDDTPGVKIQF